MIEKIISIAYLSEQIRNLLKSKAIIFMHESGDLTWPDASVVDVVLMGGAPSLIQQKAFFLPRQPMRLWVLSRAHRTVLTKLLGVPKSNVGLIPRSKVFPVRPRLSGGSRTIDAIDAIVVSSRNARRKNIELTIGVAVEIQKLISEREKRLVPFYWYGSRLDQNKVERELKKWKWIETPDASLCGDAGPNWISRLKNPRRTLLLNFSTSYEEDFGVSLAQAEEAGMPIALSRWAAHLDLHSSRRVYVARTSIEAASRSRAALNQSARNIARQILDRRRWVLPKKATREADPVVEPCLYRDLERIFEKQPAELRRALALLFRDKRNARIDRRTKTRIDRWMEN